MSPTALHIQELLQQRREKHIKDLVQEEVDKLNHSDDTEVDKYIEDYTKIDQYIRHLLELPPIAVILQAIQTLQGESDSDSVSVSDSSRES